MNEIETAGGRGSRVPERRFEHRVSEHRLRELRRALAQWLAHDVTDRRVRDDLVLAASELCATALAAPAGGGEPPVLVLRAWVDGAAVVVEVADADGAVLGTASRGLAARAGPGLQVVAAVTDVVTVRTGDRRLMLRARKERAALV